jgi:hypothetical protein
MPRIKNILIIVNRAVDEKRQGAKSLQNSGKGGAKRAEKRRKSGMCPIRSVNQTCDWLRGIPVLDTPEPLQGGFPDAPSPRTGSLDVLAAARA